MSQQEVVRAIKEELGSSISQAYLSQVENGARKHLTDSTRMLLAQFFKVHPGYLVNDPEGFQTELRSEVREVEESLDLWLIRGAEKFSKDPELQTALLALAGHANSRECLLLLRAIVDAPGLAEQLTTVLLAPDSVNGKDRS